MKLRKEVMSAEFTKYKFSYHGLGKKYFHTVLHHFTGPDRGDPHSHPWSFRSTVLAGSYVERVYTIHPDATWSTQLIHRQSGDKAHLITKDTIHEIVELLEGECWTAVVPISPVPVPWHFWRFDEKGIWRRTLREKKFRRYTG